MDFVFEVPQRWVVSDILEGEAILLDLRSGRYYSSLGVGALIWQAIIAGSSRTQIVEGARAAYPELQVADEVEAFLDDLIAYQLMSAVPAGAVLPSPPPTFDIPYARPKLEMHDDMQDLFMLDPIHDVDEAGWPTRKPLELEGRG